MASKDSAYYVDKHGDVFTNVIKDSNGQIISGMRVEPDTGNISDVPMIFIGNPELTAIPANSNDEYFSWKQSTSSVDTKTNSSLSDGAYVDEKGTEYYISDQAPDTTVRDLPPLANTGPPPTSVNSIDPPPPTPSSPGNPVESVFNALPPEAQAVTPDSAIDAITSGQLLTGEIPQEVEAPLTNAGEIVTSEVGDAEIAEIISDPEDATTSIPVGVEPAIRASGDMPNVDQPELLTPLDGPEAQTTITNKEEPTTIGTGGIGTGDNYAQGSDDGQTNGANGTVVAGAGADGGNVQGTGTGSPIPKAFIEKITPRSNPFNGFATMTYSVSVYFLSSAQFRKIMTTGVKDVVGLDLIMQSGGATAEGKGQYGATRSPYFSLDYYIDDIELKGVVSGTSVGAPHNVFEIFFNVTEPNGLTFLDNLHAGVHNFLKRVEKMSDDDIGPASYTNQLYLMVVRFYGWDANGEMVDGTKINKTESTSDPKAVTEKFIPFIFRGIKFKLDNNLVRYRCECSCPQSHYAMSAAHGTLPFNVDVAGNTLGTVLAGSANAKTSTLNEPDAAETARDNDQTTAAQQNNQNKKSEYISLVDALNNEQQKLVKKGLLTYPNTYQIEFEPGYGIEKKKIIFDGSTNKSASAMPSTDANPSAPETDRVNKENRIVSFQAGTSIMQIIEQTVRNSEFIREQQNIIIDEVTKKPVPKDPNKKNETFVWFKINTTVLPSKLVDPITGDYAYDITYTISPYAVNTNATAYFPSSFYRGVHKRFPYWFTGENTQILSLNQEFNYMYYTQFGSEPGALEKNLGMNTIHVAKRYYMPHADETSHGGANRVTEPAASMASILYSPGDLANVTIEIMGDPDFIAQSEIFYTPRVRQKVAGLDAWLPDGSVNYDASEVLFSIEYNTPYDYDNDGVMQVGKNNPYKKSRLPGNADGPVMSIAYRANEIITNLSKGAFTQKIQGTLILWSDSDKIKRDEKGNLVTTDTKRKSDIAESMSDADKQRLLKSSVTETDAEAALMDTALEHNTEMDSDQTKMLLDQEADFAVEEDTASVQVPDTVSDDTPGATTIEDHNAAMLEQQKLNSGEPLTSDVPGPDAISNPDPVPSPVNDTPATSTTEEFNNPAPPPTGPGWTEPEQLSRIPPGVTEDPLTEGTDQMYYYKGKNISGRTQAELDAQIQAIDSGEPVSYDAYDPMLNQRVRVNYDPVTDTTVEEGYYDETTGKFIKD